MNNIYKKQFLIWSFLILIFFYTVNAQNIESDFIIENNYVLWNESVNLKGNINQFTSITAYLDNKIICSTTSDSLGNWNCNFNAPLEIGTYNLMVKYGNITLNKEFYVKFSYGFEPVGIEPRYVFEAPNIIQEPSGNINKIITRIKVSR